MTREEIVEELKHFISTLPKEPPVDCDYKDEWVDEDTKLRTALEYAIKSLELRPCCTCIDFKRYAKQMGFSIERQSIPFLMHKEMNIPLSECQKAYDVAVDYLRNQGKVKG